MSTPTPTCTSKTTGAYATHGEASGSTPSNCTTEVLEPMLYGCVTWSPRACHYDTLRRAHHNFLTCCIDWRNNNRTHYPISYLDTLIKMGSDPSRRLCAGGRSCSQDCGAHGGHETAEVRYIRRIGDGRGLFWGPKNKEWMGCFLDDHRDFGINAYQRTTAAQDEGEWRKTPE